MKRLLLSFVLIFGVAPFAQAEVILLPTGITITDAEAAALRNDLLDLEAWVRKAVAGKIANATERMHRHWIPKLQADQTITSIPSRKDALTTFIVNHPKYKDRAARDAALR